jgi:probable F420-dependent oxidoreductase
MEIGLHLPSAQAGADAAAILEVARAAERLGFDAVWMFDHLMTPVDLASKYPYSRDGSYLITARDPFFDPLGLFGVLAGATSRIRIGTGVLVAAYRHPIVVAKALATIERFAPGRIVLGIGNGWMREEFEAVGVPFERRGERFDEYLRALKLIWSGEPVEMSGEFYAWQKAGFLPAPTRPIPLIVGGHSDAALRRAARLGDGWAIVTGKGQGSGIDAIADRIGVLRGLLAAEGREGAPFELLCQNVLAFSDAPIPGMPFSGPPEAIAESIRRLSALGVTMIDLFAFGETSAIVESAHRFAEQVRPAIG